MSKRSPLISPDSRTFAKAVVRKIVTLTRTLARFPRSGRKVPELDDENTRELIAYSYRIIYTVEQDQVTIAAVIHGKRML
jgi:plasmid stabilization system protein ParE